MKLLHNLLRQLGTEIDFAGLPDEPVTGIIEDSRQVVPGSLFIARAGTKTDGTLYIKDARARGALAVVSESAVADSPLPVVIVPNAASAASRLAQAFQGHPSATLKVLAVTGTKGKTTVAYLVRHILNRLGHKCGMIGTVELDDGQHAVEASMTTPPSTEVARLMAAMRHNGCHACAIEVSSHALHQHRVDGVHFAAGAFTNLTGDHLDYHKTTEAYADAKQMLFRTLDAHAVAVVNMSSPWASHMLLNCEGRIIRAGFADQSTEPLEYAASQISYSRKGSEFVLSTPRGKAKVNMILVGRHNVENALLAAAMVGEVFHVSAGELAEVLADAAGAPGRLQPVICGQKFAVLVDYAHTDDALKNVLSAMRPLTAGKLRVLFGCGGDRDATKRPRMARISQQLADAVYITSDNPRTEQPQAIIDQVLTGIDPSIDKPVKVQIDRRQAIADILGDACEGDVVIIAGKGHENYQIIGTTKHHFDDVEEATAVLTSLRA